MSDNVAIAVIAPLQPEDFYDQLWEGVWEATFDLAAFGVRVDNLTTEHRDVANQRAILEGLLGAGMSAIAIVPAHHSAVDELIDRHELSGTPVIAFRADAPASKRTAFVGADAKRSGALAGEVLTKLMAGRGRIVSFAGDQEDSDLAGRYAGLRAELACRGGQVTETSAILDPQCGGLSPELRDLLSTAGGIYIGDEEMIQMAAVLHHSGLRLPCISFGNTPQVRQLMANGMLSAVVDESRHRQGYFAVQKAYQATLERNRVESLFMPSGVAFSANAMELQAALHDAFELLMRQRTEVLCTYKARLEQANAELLNLSITDPLTGLLNRRKFETSLQHEAARARRYGPMSLLILDVNLFKTVNDTYGHQAGDEVLKMVADALKACCRSTDICASLGGDEFGIILPHSDRGAAVVVRERMMRRMADAAVTVGKQKIQVSVSGGIGTLPDDARQVEGLMAAADADMYRVKQASRASRLVS